MQQPLRHALLIFILVLTGSYGFAAKANAGQTFEQKLKIVLFSLLIGAVVYVFERRLLKLAQAQLSEAVPKAVEEALQVLSKKNEQQSRFRSVQTEIAPKKKQDVSENETSQS